MVLFLKTVFSTAMLGFLFSACPKSDTPTTPPPPAPPAIISPVAGDVFLMGDTITVSWSGSDAGVIILASRFQQVFDTSTIVSQTGQTARVVLPDSLYTTDCRLKVVGQTLNEISGTFSLKSLVLTYPTGGETFTRGDTVKILWREYATIPGVNVEFSTNSGKNYVFINESAQVDPGVKMLSWVVGAEIDATGVLAYPSSSCKIKVSSYQDNSEKDNSQNFTAN